MTTEREAELHEWWGISTFFRCPIEEDPAAMDVALDALPYPRDRRYAPAQRHEQRRHHEGHRGLVPAFRRGPSRSVATTR